MHVPLSSFRISLDKLPIWRKTLPGSHKIPPFPKREGRGEKEEERGTGGGGRGKGKREEGRGKRKQGRGKGERENGLRMSPKRRLEYLP